MCLLLKVANRRESDDYARFPATANTETTTTSASTSTTTTAAAVPYFNMQQQDQPDYLLSAVVAPNMVFGHAHQSQDMSAMVTALTHVVSGQRHGGQASGAVAPAFAAGGSGGFIPSGVDSPSAYSSSSSGSWAGQKRRRDQDFDSSAYRTGFGELSSSSIKTGNYN